jgi:outer membrane protein assembly factor BamB
VKRFAAHSVLLLACWLLLAIARAGADNWPQWRGPTDDGICTETNLPTKWSATENIAWKLPLPGKGGSTPVVWRDRIFLTSADGQDIVLVCVSTSGKELWKRKLGSGDKKYMGGEGNNASASACTDGKHVWAPAGTGDLACFDLDGKEVWRCDLQERYGKISMFHGGMHVSPLLDDGRLYLSLLHSNARWVIALDKATGSEAWKVERKTDARNESEQSYASPIMWRKGKDAYLIIHGGDYTTAHRLNDGSEIWRVGDLNPKTNYNGFYRFVATPAASSELIVIPTAKNGVVVGLRPDAQGMVSKGSKYELWRRPNGTPDVPCPLIHGGLVYLCREDKGSLVCLDAKTGEQLYAGSIHRHIYRASPVFADGKIYCAARDGTVTVVKAGPKFEVLAENKLPDEMSASPAIANGRIYLRGWDALYAIGKVAQ